METIAKSLLIDSIEKMPDRVEVDEVIEQIILLSKIERARRQLDNGESSTHEQVMESYKKWLE